MIAAGEPVSATAVISGLAYLDALQNTDGGLPYTAGKRCQLDCLCRAGVGRRR
ncbi:MAG TPA: hypothetical protein GYA08_08070 [Chloroflexi bacterium]|nr:hypothetical protein [Chloroflexota bacterium]